MTPNQTSLYWREWAAVRRVQPEADRHALHAQALGVDKSSKTFTNADFDKVLGVFRSISQPANMEAQLRQMKQEHTRLVWKVNVEQRALLGVYVERVDDYIRAICWNKFHTASFRDLKVTQLEDLRSTLARAIDRKRKEAGHTNKQLRQLAGLVPSTEADECVPVGAEVSGPQDDNEPF